MVAAAWYTLQYNVGVSIVDQLNSISARNIEQQLREDLWHLTSQSDKINSIVQKPFYGESDRAYIDAIDKLRHEGTELISTATYAGDFVDLSSLPFDVIQHRLIAPRLAPDTSSLPPYGQVCDIVGQSSAPAFMLVDLKSPQAIPPPDVTLESLFKNYRAYVSRAACVMGIGTDPFNFPDLAKLLVDSKSRINLLALWGFAFDLRRAWSCSILHAPLRRPDSSQSRSRSRALPHRARQLFRYHPRVVLVADDQSVDGFLRCCPEPVRYCLFVRLQRRVFLRLLGADGLSGHKLDSPHRDQL